MNVCTSIHLPFPLPILRRVCSSLNKILFPINFVFGCFLFSTLLLKDSIDSIPSAFQYKNNKIAKKDSFNVEDLCESRRHISRNTFYHLKLVVISNGKAINGEKF